MLHTAPGWTVLTRFGVVDDHALSGLVAVAAGGVHVRLVIGQIGSSCHCCIGTPADIVAVSPGDPSLPEGLRQALLDDGQGVAFATAEADHLVGSALISESVSLPIVRTMVEGDPTIFVRFSDAGTFLDGNPDLVSVVVFERRQDAEIPEGWDSVRGAEDQSCGAAIDARPAPVQKVN